MRSTRCLFRDERCPLSESFNLCTLWNSVLLDLKVFQSSATTPWDGGQDRRRSIFMVQPYPLAYPP